MRARPDVDLKRRIHGRSVSCGRRMDVVLMPKGSEWPRKKSSSYAFKRRSYFLRKPASRGRYRHTTRSSCRYETLWKEDGSERGTATRMNSWCTSSGATFSSPAVKRRSMRAPVTVLSYQAESSIRPRALEESEVLDVFYPYREDYAPALVS